MVECEFRFSDRIFYRFLVLIDTWWNVNFDRIMNMKSSIRFNRYMVECELRNDGCNIISD